MGWPLWMLSIMGLMPSAIWLAASCNCCGMFIVFVCSCRMLRPVGGYNLRFKSRYITTPMNGNTTAAIDRHVWSVSSASVCVMCFSLFDVANIAHYTQLSSALFQ